MFLSITSKESSELVKYNFFPILTFMRYSEILKATSPDFQLCLEFPSLLNLQTTELEVKVSQQVELSWHRVEKVYKENNSKWNHNHIMCVTAEGMKDQERSA